MLEQGLLAILIYGKILRKAIKYAGEKSTGDYLSRLRFISILTYPIAILSSSGTTSNYYFLTCLFLLIQLKEQNTSRVRVDCIRN